MPRKQEIRIRRVTKRKLVGAIDRFDGAKPLVQSDMVKSLVDLAISHGLDAGITVRKGPRLEMTSIVGEDWLASMDARAQDCGLPLPRYLSEMIDRGLEFVEGKHE